MRKPLFPRPQVIRLSRLLDMLYRPAEIASEISVNVDTVYRSYLPAGAPHQRDARGNIWIHGTSFAAWAKETIGKRKAERHPLPDGQAWCMRCNLPVPLENPTERIINHYLGLYQGKCPTCGTTVSRAYARPGKGRPA